MKTKAVIFDFNGTLFDDTIYNQRAWIQYFKEAFNMEISIDEFKANFMGIPNVGILQNYFPDMTLQEAQVHSHGKEVMYQSMVMDDGQPSLIEGAPQFFDYLMAHHVPMTIASAANQFNFQFYFNVFNLDKWFKFDEIIYDNGQYLDKAAMFAQAAVNLNRKPEECIVFEDSFAGYDAALTAGIVEVYLLSDIHVDNVLQFSNYNEVLNAINTKKIDLLICQ